MTRFTITAAGLLGLLGVAMGAFGAHAMKARLSTSGLSDVYQTASLYCLVHALALLGLGTLLINSPQPKVAKRLIWGGRLLFTGVLIFSGSLWILAIFELRWLGMITPIGGLTLLAGWLFIALSGLAYQSLPE